LGEKMVAINDFWWYFLVFERFLRDFAFDRDNFMEWRKIRKNTRGKDGKEL